MEEAPHAGRRFKLKKLRKRQSSSEDCISMMPDEILVSILSRLTTREAARTSILSRRWKYLWTFTICLDFDSSELVHEMRYGFVKKADNVGRPGFVDWVNEVLRLHKSRTLDEFRICFCVDEKSHKCDIDRWMHYAFERRAKRIDFNLLCCIGYLPAVKYTITRQFLHNYNLDNLTVCRLNSVDLTAEVLEHILYSCPNLGVLSVGNASSLLQAKVSGPSLRLKCLEILECHSLRSIEISAVNLSSFKYSGPNLSISYKDVPCLVDVSFKSPYCCYLVRDFERKCPLLSQLKTLALDFKFEPFDKIPKFPKLRNLNQLELILSRLEICRYEKWLSTLKAFPGLHKFTLQLYGPAYSSSRGKTKLLKWKRRKVTVPKQKFQHKCLKVFRLAGFIPHRYDIDLARSVLCNTLALERIIIELHDVLFVGDPYKYDPEVKFAARECAQVLKKKLPTGTEMVIL